ncbi:hypothetical protein B9Z55_027924 [Caenorhabditis nigoni]|uniref:Uncharacterized protein n=1 Tax=Caenorhabditis nigoni TaxID=1611254 RepID=A0A2G5SEK9_9PELO|nr:hypothetical protein B9Z55_027924 [Caenorhabditis nigoni]
MTNVELHLTDFIDVTWFLGSWDGKGSDPILRGQLVTLLRSSTRITGFRRGSARKKMFDAGCWKEDAAHCQETSDVLLIAILNKSIHGFRNSS